nr:MAG TPA: hypothetical protein [Caudoviricetes sp.]
MIVCIYVYGLINTMTKILEYKEAITYESLYKSM